MGKESKFSSFYFQTCCNVMNTASNELTVLHKIEAETFQPGRKFSRVWFGSDNVTRPSVSSRTVVLRRSPSGALVHCQEHIVYLKENTRDIQSPIKMKLSYTLDQRDPPRPAPGQPLPNIDDYPILNQQEAAKILLVTFQKDCGSDDICQSQLIMESFLDLPRGKWHRGPLFGTRATFLDHCRASEQLLDVHVGRRGRHSDQRDCQERRRKRLRDSALHFPPCERALQQD